MKFWFNDKINGHALHKVQDEKILMELKKLAGIINKGLSKTK